MKEVLKDPKQRGIVKWTQKSAEAAIVCGEVSEEKEDLKREKFHKAVCPSKKHQSHSGPVY